MESFTNERLIASLKALEDIELVIKYLKEAKGLGVADMMGGMMIVSNKKYEKIELANKAEKNFERDFKKMIAKKNFEPDKNSLRVEIEAGVRFLDIFFDNLVVDVAVQAKIDSALVEAENIKEKIETIVAMV